jgi:hypothetical protein
LPERKIWHLCRSEELGFLHYPTDSLANPCDSFGTPVAWNPRRIVPRKIPQKIPSKKGSPPDHIEVVSGGRVAAHLAHLHAPIGVLQRLPPIGGRRGVGASMLFEQGRRRLIGSGHGHHGHCLGRLGSIGATAAAVVAAVVCGGEHCAGMEKHSASAAAAGMLLLLLMLRLIMMLEMVVHNFLESGNGMFAYFCFCILFLFLHIIFVFVYFISKCECFSVSEQLSEQLVGICMQILRAGNNGCLLYYYSL